MEEAPLPPGVRRKSRPASLWVHQLPSQICSVRGSNNTMCACSDIEKLGFICKDLDASSMSLDSVLFRDPIVCRVHAQPKGHCSSTIQWGLFLYNSTGNVPCTIQWALFQGTIQWAMFPVHFNGHCPLSNSMGNVSLLCVLFRLQFNGQYSLFKDQCV